MLWDDLTSGCPSFSLTPPPSPAPAAAAADDDEWGMLVVWGSSLASVLGRLSDWDVARRVIGNLPCTLDVTDDTWHGCIVAALHDDDAEDDEGTLMTFDWDNSCTENTVTVTPVYH